MSVHEVGRAANREAHRGLTGSPVIHNISDKQKYKSHRNILDSVVDEDDFVGQ